MNRYRRTVELAFAFIFVLVLPAAVLAQTGIEPPPQELLMWDGHDEPYGGFQAWDVAVDKWGVVYVTDGDTDRVFKFLSDGSYVDVFGSPGQLLVPKGIAVDPTGYMVYVVDYGHERVQVFTDTGDHIRELTVASPPLLFSQPHDVIVDDAGDVYITDKSRHSVSKYDSSGAFVTSWGGFGDTPGKFDTPLGITVDELGRIWVADSKNRRLQIFTSTGSFVGEWVDGVGTIAIREPWDLVIDDRGNVYLSNDHNDLIKYDRNKVRLSLARVLDNAEGLALFGNGTIYVADAFPSRIKKLGYPPTMRTITDVPGDQGLSVRLEWDASVLDRLNAPMQVTGYTVYRRLTGAGGAPPHPTGKNAPALEATSGLEGWDVLATIPARGDTSYQYVAPTLCDSTYAGTCWSVFVVSAFTPYGEFHDCPPDSGYSTDDIPPPVPGGLVVFENPGDLELQLNWDPSAAPDFAYYGVYRGATPGFAVADPHAPLATTTSPTYVDDTVAPGETWYYRVAAFDDADNCSGTSSSDGATVLTSADATPALVFGLEQNVPNPFNPSTSIAFSLEADNRVTLVIYDSTGRKVRTLVDRAMQRGVYSQEWDGYDNAGHLASSGVYFYCLKAGDRSSTRKMVLLK